MEKGPLMIYTFRTNPFKEKLREMFPQVFVFGKLKEDFKGVSEIILEKEPTLLLGIAKTNGASQFECKAINRFNKNKKISQGKPSFDLCIPDKDLLNVSKKASDSFCNWTMYKLSEFIEENSLKTKLAFTHLNEKDLDKLLKL